MPADRAELRRATLALAGPLARLAPALLAFWADAGVTKASMRTAASVAKVLAEAILLPIMTSCLR